MMAKACVGSAFAATDRLMTCSLLGAMTQYTISRDMEGNLETTKRWSAGTKALEKVNAMAGDESYVK